MNNNKNKIIIIRNKIIKDWSNNKFRDWPYMIQAEFENGIEVENNFQIQDMRNRLPTWSRWWWYLNKLKHRVQTISL